MHRTVCVLLATALVGCASLAEANDNELKAKRLRVWKGIVPGKTLVKDVEKTLGEPTKVIQDSTWRGVKGLEIRDYAKKGEPYVMVGYKDGKAVVVSQVPEYTEFPKADKRLHAGRWVGV